MMASLQNYEQEFVVTRGTLDFYKAMIIVLFGGVFINACIGLDTALDDYTSLAFSYLGLLALPFMAWGIIEMFKTKRFVTEPQPIDTLTEAES